MARAMRTMTSVMIVNLVSRQWSQDMSAVHAPVSNVTITASRGQPVGANHTDGVTYGHIQTTSPTGSPTLAVHSIGKACSKEKKTT